MSAKVKKLEDQFRSDSAIQQQRDGNSSTIFSGVAIYVNGFTGETFIILRVCSFFGVILLVGKPSKS